MSSLFSFYWPSNGFRGYPLQSQPSLPVLSGTSSQVLGVLCSGCHTPCLLWLWALVLLSALSFRCGYMRRSFAFLTTCWAPLVSPSCRCFSGSPTSLLFRWVFLMLLPFVLVVSIPSPWFADSIGSTVSLAKGSPFGSSRFRLALARPCCLGLEVCLFPSSWVLERLSVTPRPVSLVPSSFLSVCVEELCFWW